MSEQDWTQDDAEVLAEFAGYNFRQNPRPNSGYEESFPQDILVFTHFIGDVRVAIIKSKKPDIYDIPWFHPWSLEAPQWQIKSCLDAVQEKELEDEFLVEFGKIIGSSNPRDVDEASFTAITAPPSAVCEAILSMEVE